VRQPLRLEPPTRKASPVALHAWRESRDKDRPGKSDGPRWNRRRAGGVVAAVVGALAVLAALTALLLPGCIRRHAIATAAAHGVALTVDGVQLAPGRYVLSGVTLSSPEMPSITMRAAEVEVETAWLEVTRVTAKNGEIAATGSYDAVLGSIVQWHAAHKKPGANAPTATFGFEAMHLVWSLPVAGVSRLDALEMRADFSPRAGESHVKAPHATLDTKRGTLGPWRFNYDRESKTTRARVGFDPQLGDGPSVLVIADDDRVTSLELNVARTTLGSLGLPASVLGLPGASDATATEASARYTWHSPGRAEAKATLAMFGLRMTRAMPLDAKVDLESAGDPTAGMAIKRGELTLGPLKGQVTGQVRVERGTRIDLAFTTASVPCSAFLLAPSAGANPTKLNEIADQLKQLAQALGLAKITGEYRAEGALTIDVGDPAKTAASFSAQSTCEAELFGQ
jgi:hypothetical protein